MGFNSGFKGLNMLNILTRGSFRRVRKIAKSDY